MANDLVYKVNGDTSGFKSSMEDAAQSAEKFDEVTERASQDVGKMGKKIDDVADSILKEIRAMDKRVQKTSNYRQQLGFLTKKITDLTVRYREMSEAERNSAKGREIFQHLEELKAKAANIKDAISDVNTEINAMSSDHQTWDGIAQGLDTINSVAQTVVGSMGLSNEKTEKLMKTLTALQTVQAGFNSVIKIGNTFNQSSNAIKAVQAVQNRLLVRSEQMLTAAKTAGTAATVRATVAQKVFNAIARANPYVLLATGIIAVVGAVAALTAAFGDNEKEVRKNKDELDKLKQKQSEWQAEVGRTTGKSIADYKRLQREYVKLSSTASKTKWITDNKQAFHDLGIAIRSIEDADRAFISNTDNVVKALQSRARAMALQNRLVKVYEEGYEKIQKIEDEYNNKSFKDDSKGRQEKVKAFKQKIADQKAALTQMEKDAEKYANEIDGLMTKSVATLGTPDNGASSKNGSSKSKGETEYAKRLAEAEKLFNDFINTSYNSSDELEDAVDRIVLKCKEMVEVGNKLKIPENKSLAEVYDRLVKATKEISDYQEKGIITQEEAKEKAKEILSIYDSFGLVPPKDLMEQSLSFIAQLRNEYNELRNAFNQVQSDFDAGLIDEEEAIREFESINRYLNSKNLKPIEIPIKPKTDADGLRKFYEDMVRAASNLMNDVEIGLVSKEDAINQINAINKYLQSLNLNPIDVEIKAKFDKRANFFDKVEGIQAMSDSVFGLADSFRALNERWDDMSDFEKFESVIDGFFGVVNAVKSAIEGYNALMSAVKAASAAQKMAQAVSDSNTIKEVANSGKKVAANAAETGSEVTKAAAKTFSAHSWIPWVGVAIAGAMVGMMIAQMSSVKSQKFSNGGYVKGNTTVGDKIPAMLNANELVLNNQQQGRLWKVLNGQLATPNSQLEGKVKFEIEGTKLYGVLQNFERKKARI